MAAGAALAAALGVMAFAQTTTTTSLIYNGSPVNGYLGGNASFPSEFIGTLCEGGRSAPDSNNSCVTLNRGGTGTWENDAGPGRRLPPTPIKWYVVADQQGTVTRESSAERDTYYIIFEFAQPYYSFGPGDLYATSASLLKGSTRRVIVHSKYRDLG